MVKLYVVVCKTKISIDYKTILVLRFVPIVCHSVQAMQRSVSAVVYHCSEANDREAGHMFCDKGETTWCKYQNAKLQDTVFVDKPGIPIVVGDLILPVYGYEQTRFAQKMFACVYSHNKMFACVYSHNVCMCVCGMVSSVIMQRM